MFPLLKQIPDNDNGTGEETEKLRNHIFTVFISKRLLLSCQGITQAYLLSGKIPYCPNDSSPERMCLYPVSPPAGCGEECRGLGGYMIIAAIIFRLHAPWVHSLKEKRMVVKSLVTQLQNRFHVSAAETDEQDTHQIIVIGAAAIVPHNAMADRLMDEISAFVETSTDAVILEEQRELR